MIIISKGRLFYQIFISIIAIIIAIWQYPSELSTILFILLISSILVWTISKGRLVYHIPVFILAMMIAIWRHPSEISTISILIAATALFFIDINGLAKNNK